MCLAPLQVLDRAPGRDVVGLLNAERAPPGAEPGGGPSEAQRVGVAHRGGGAPGVLPIRQLPAARLKNAQVLREKQRRL